jgi:hypothetical protein
MGGTKFKILLLCMLNLLLQLRITSGDRSTSLRMASVERKTGGNALTFDDSNSRRCREHVIHSCGSAVGGEGRTLGCFGYQILI